MKDSGFIYITAYLIFMATSIFGFAFDRKYRHSFVGVINLIMIAIIVIMQLVYNFI